MFTDGCEFVGIGFVGVILLVPWVWCKLVDSVGWACVWGRFAD